MICSVWKDIYTDCWIILETHYDLACMICEKVTSFLEKSENLPSLIQGIGLALLTILIPLAIAIITNAYSKSKEEEPIEFEVLDSHVIIETVFQVKYIVISVFLIFVPMFCWEFSLPFWRLIEIIISSYGIALLVKQIDIVYRWMKGNVFEYRFLYLENVKEPNDLELVWRSVWEREEINEQDEIEFLKKFCSIIDTLLNKSNNGNLIVQILLNDFNDNLNKRSHFSLVMNTKFIDKILEWHRYIWGKNKNLHSNNVSSEVGFHFLLLSLDSTIKGVEEQFLHESNSPFFLDKIKSHLARIIHKKRQCIS